MEVLVRKSPFSVPAGIPGTGSWSPAGSAANGYLRDRMINAARKEGIDVFVPKPVLCTDNAAMIACVGYYRSRHCPSSESDPLSLDAHPNLPF